MAVGDVVQGLSSITTGNYLDIQPTAGAEWVIHNVMWDKAVEVYFSDGTNNLKLDIDTSYGGRIGTVFHCTNSKYYRIKANGATTLIGYDGVVTK